MAKAPLRPSAALTVVLLLLLVAAASWLQTADAASGFCSSKCGVRCGRGGSARARGACMRTCGLCCEECNCVPTGGRAGFNECPCYRNMLTAGPKKRPKCP
ncbi:hypothetical protein HU200_022730 [Digitaria exilis]|uniref:Uncharacterized protein n=1 Tax=Digitaria exilis TaxID=1010633 RepID=A0A835C159_9POAL|nr:hypothetical protein HU200_022730 [Digitaria exilis]CAB3494009.1 unnamed protein product [Digitaria exilis]